MQELLDVVRFEFRYQLRSPFFLGAVVMVALIHLMAISGVTIHIVNDHGRGRAATLQILRQPKRCRGARHLRNNGRTR